MKKCNLQSGFSFIEILIVILVVSSIFVGITQGTKVISDKRLRTARNITNNSKVASMKNDIILWLDSTDSDTIALGTTSASSFGESLDGKFVVHWEDKNNSKIEDRISMSASLDANRPIYVKKAIGNLPSLSFNGSKEQNDNYLITTPGVIPPRKQAFSAAIVFVDNNTKSSQHFLISQGGSCIGGDFGITTEEYIRYIGCGVASTADLDSFLTTKSKTPYILIVNVDKERSEDQISFYLNQETFQGNPNFFYPLESNIFSIGRSANGNGYFSGLISEIIIFNRYLEHSEIEAIQNYLSTKYSIKF